VVVMAAALISGVAAVSPRSLDPQSPGENCRYFVETGYYVCDEFLEFYETRGEIEIFGYPLTEAFDDPARGMRVQYFQRARMEWHPSNPDPYKVQLGLLVDELGYHFPQVRPEQIPPFNSGVKHYFPETGHVVSYAFLDYFRENGGLDIFGYPRSEFMYEDGYIVQYFQRAQMEWHPENVSGSQMCLINLGEDYIKRFDVDVSYRPETNPPVMGLDVSASVRHVITGRDTNQTVFVYVTDQRKQPVKGAAVSVVVHYQSGAPRYECEPTSASGFTRCSFDVLPSTPGEKVVVDMMVTYRDVTGTTQTFFLPWW